MGTKYVFVFLFEIKERKKEKTIIKSFFQYFFFLWLNFVSVGWFDFHHRGYNFAGWSLLGMSSGPVLQILSHT